MTKNREKISEVLNLKRYVPVFYVYKLERLTHPTKSEFDSWEKGEYVLETNSLMTAESCFNGSKVPMGVFVRMGGELSRLSDNLGRLFAPKPLRKPYAPPKKKRTKINPLDVRP